MTVHELDTVALERDLPEYGLRRGDLGAVVHVHGDRGIEVEFVRLSGETQALVQLRPDNVRAELRATRGDRARYAAVRFVRAFRVGWATDKSASGCAAATRSNTFAGPSG